MIPGPELDCMVAEKVMGWTKIKCQVGPLGTGYGYETYCWSGNNTLINIWNPSGNIAHAWEVVERVTDPTLPRVGNFPPSTRFMAWWRRTDLWAESSTDAAYAICLAALMAVGAIEVELWI